jgi:hypothetical protein
VRDLWNETTVRVCEVEGCNSVAASGRYCDACAGEIEALEAWRCKHEARALDRLLRRQEWMQRFLRAARWSTKLIWIPELAFVAACLVYLGWEFGAMFLQWMGQL